MECTRMAAESATDPELRETLLGMAKIWIQAAVNCEKAIALVDDDWPTLDTRRSVMTERQIARLTGLILGGICFGMLVLNALAGT